MTLSIFEAFRYRKTVVATLAVAAAAVSCSAILGIDDRGEILPDAGAGASGSVGQGGSGGSGNKGGTAGSGGVPECRSNTDCAESKKGPICDPATGVCVACTAAIDLCGEGQYCSDMHTCEQGCANDADCGGVLKCDVATHVCTGCSTDEECPLGTLCEMTKCLPGCSPTHGCQANHTCCGSDCVSLADDIAHCGDCDTACDGTNGTATCRGGTCSITCNGGFTDCDADPSTGCEIATATDTQHCGDCGTVCTNANGNTSCAGGACSPTCNPGFKSCDSDPNNGCETNTNTNVNHCGMCNNLCPASGGTPNCVQGQCGTSMCPAGKGDCDGNMGNGCEATFATDPNNCGSCGNKCIVNHGTPGCSANICTIASCDPGWANCDGIVGNGCETNTQTDVMHCGGCPNQCMIPNGTPSCVSGQCGIASCNPNWQNCNPSIADGCETDLTSVAHCGTCTNVCGNQNGTPSCTGTPPMCSIACNGGFANCDGNFYNGCEGMIGTPPHCGSCLFDCQALNGTTSCNGNSCKMNCYSSYADCNMLGGDGCEASLNNPMTCGDCFTMCTLSQYCSNGSCFGLSSSGSSAGGAGPASNSANASSSGSGMGGLPTPVGSGGG